MVDWDTVLIAFAIYCVYILFLAIVAIITDYIIKKHNINKKRKQDLERRLSYCERQLEVLKQAYFKYRNKENKYEK